MEQNMIVIRDLYFHLDWPKNVDENLKHEIEFMIIKNEMEQLTQYNHGINIHEHRKQQKE